MKGISVQLLMRFHFSLDFMQTVRFQTDLYVYFAFVISGDVAVKWATTGAPPCLSGWVWAVRQAQELSDAVSEI